MSIRTLLGSHLHHVNIELYQRHRTLADGRCAACGHQHPCQAARHASLVIREAGEDPRWYDGKLTPAEAPNRDGWQPGEVNQSVQSQACRQTVVLPQTAVAPSPAYAGYAVGDNSRRVSISYAAYER